MKLEHGNRVVVVGGGPSGSFLALHLVEFARQAGIGLKISLFEPRRFDGCGPSGCNMCAGILAAPLVHNLSRLGLELPRQAVMTRISSYCMHTPFGSIEVPQPHPLEPILAVYRGCGPRGSELGRDVSFDRFLLNSAVQRGVRVVRRAVDDVNIGPVGPTVVVDGESIDCELLVLATGVNSTLPGRVLPPYQRPPTRRMVQDELLVGADTIARTLGDRIHVFTMPGDRLDFGTLIPKGDYVGVSLLSGLSSPMGMDEFLEHPQVRAWLPSDFERTCGCKPAIAVGPARHPHGDRVVVVGDAAVTRLFKDGIGTAFQTAREAARTAVFAGVSDRAFRRHYRPLCDRLARDNGYGRLLMSVHRRVKGSRWFFDLQSRVIEDEKTAPYPARRFDQVSWGMFTGALPYRGILRRALSPRLWWAFARSALKSSPPGEARDGGPTMVGERRPRQVVVLGAGFAGVTTALKLEEKLGRDPDVNISLVSDENFFLFTPMLHEVASGHIETRHIALPIRRMRGKRRFDFVQSDVRSVDLDRKVVVTHRGEMPYDALVLALGSVTDYSAIRGKRKHVLGLKSLTDAMALRNHLIRMFERADASQDDPSRALTFTVVGGGITGVQAVADLNDLVRRALPREYLRIHPDSIRVVLLQDHDSVLPEMHPRLARAARKILEDAGVEVLTGTTVTDVGEGWIQVDGCRRIDTDTVVWTPGIKANPVVASLPVGRDALGRVKVNDRLEVPGYPGVYALGDNAHQPHHRTGQPLPPTAHIAIRQPRAVVHNVVSYLRGGPSRPYRYWHMGLMVSLGPRNAMADVLGVRVHGLAARLLWQAAYSTLMKGRYNQLRVLVDWGMGRVFGLDSTLLRRW